MWPLAQAREAEGVPRPFIFGAIYAHTFILALATLDNANAITYIIRNTLCMYINGLAH